MESAEGKIDTLSGEITQTVLYRVGPFSEGNCMVCMKVANRKRQMLFPL